MILKKGDIVRLFTREEVVAAHKAGVETFCLEEFNNPPFGVIVELQSEIDKYPIDYFDVDNWIWPETLMELV